MIALLLFDNPLLMSLWSPVERKTLFQFFVEYSDTAVVSHSPENSVVSINKLKTTSFSLAQARVQVQLP